MLLLIVKILSGKNKSHNGLLLKNKLRLRNVDANSFEHTKLRQAGK